MEADVIDRKDPPAQTPSARGAILDAAAQVFSEQGFAGTSIRSIAEAAGIRSASLYYHFASKEEIFAEIMKIGVESVFDAVRSAVEGAPADATHGERLRLAIEAHLYSALKRGPYTRVNIRCSGQCPAAMKAKNLELRRPYEAYWRGLIRRGVAAGEFCADTDATLCSLYIFGFMNWTVEWYRPGRYALDDVVTRYSRMLTDGVSTRGAESGAIDR